MYILTYTYTYAHIHMDMNLNSSLNLVKEVKLRIIWRHQCSLVNAVYNTFMTSMKGPLGGSQLFSLRRLIEKLEFVLGPHF